MAAGKSETQNFLFAILTAPAGSLTLDTVRLTPFQVAPVPKELADKVDTDVNPVKFFDKKEDAQALADKLKAQAAEKAKQPGK